MRSPASVLVALFASTLLAAAADPVHGWRGNGTGLWPDAHPPLEWSRLPHGAMEGLRASANRPAGDQPGEAGLVEKGLICDWLMLGPLPVENSAKDIDRDLLAGEATIEPTAGQATAGLAWTPLTIAPDDVKVFGAAEPRWLDLGKPMGLKPNQVGYLHTYLYSPRGGPVCVLIDHFHGLKAWVNGREMLRETDRNGVVGSYEGLSRIELAFAEPHSPAFSCALHPGWNRLLLKLTTAPFPSAAEMRCHLRLQDPPDVPYESKNIVWMAPLPARSTSTPILVGDRLFVFCEPDEIVCLDKNSGRPLWSAFINDYEALEPEVKKANAAYAETVDPLVAELHRSTDRHQRLVLRAKMRGALEKIDPERFKQEKDGHFAAHFGIVGFTMPTPVSDGRFLYVWSGMGIAACFDLDGHRQWISTVPTRHLTYGSSPALADGVLAVFINELFGLEAATGKLLWRQPRLTTNIGAVQAARWGGQGVFIAQRGDILRASDGEFLFRPRGSSAVGDAGWAPPQILGAILYLPNYGVKNLKVYDFSEVTGEKWQPKIVSEYSLGDSISRGPKGEWIDRMTAGSPVVWQGISYMVDIYEVLYAVDLATGKLLYQQDLRMNGLTHYNAVAVAASPAIIGGKLFIENNQGTTVVIEPGRTYREIRRNRIATVLDRTFPIPAQETLCYAPPLADGSRLYLRGEAYLYCIGEK